MVIDLILLGGFQSSFFFFFFNVAHFLKKLLRYN